MARAFSSETAAAAAATSALCREQHNTTAARQRLRTAHSTPPLHSTLFHRAQHTTPLHSTRLPLQAAQAENRSPERPELATHKHTQTHTHKHTHKHTHINTCIHTFTYINTSKHQPFVHTNTTQPAYFDSMNESETAGPIRTRSKPINTKESEREQTALRCGAVLCCAVRCGAVRWDGRIRIRTERGPGIKGEIDEQRRHHRDDHSHPVAVRTHTHTHAHAHTPEYTHTYTHIYTDTRTRTHIHTRSKFATDTIRTHQKTNQKTHVSTEREAGREWEGGGGGK